MSQGALSVANGPGGTVRSGFNAALARLATRASGTGRPSDIATGENWIETDNPGAGVWSEWKYDGANDILVRLINSGSHTIIPGSVTTTKGDLIKRGTSSDARLGVGAAHTILGVNSAGDDLEYKAPGWVRLAADAFPVNVATLSFTSIPSYVKALRLIGNLRNATDNTSLNMRFSQSGVFASGAADYNYSAVVGKGIAATVQATGNNTDTAPIYGIVNGSNDANQGGATFDIVIPDVQASYGTVRGLVKSYYLNTGLSDMVVFDAGVRLNTAGAIDGVRFLPTSGNIAVGRVSILGLMA